VTIDTDSPDFIAWDDINGIDEVKGEIQEIIDYLKDPSLLRLRGVSRIGGVMLAGSPGTGKTLLAKAIAAESGVRMFTCSGGWQWQQYDPCTRPPLPPPHTLPLVLALPHVLL
jgi:cell division protease FtsH